MMGGGNKLSPSMLEANTFTMSCGNCSNSELIFSSTKLHTPPLQDEEGIVADIAKPEPEPPSVRVYDVVEPSIPSVMLIKFCKKNL